MDVYRRLMKLFKKGNLLLSVISGSSVLVCVHAVIFSVKLLEVLASLNTSRVVSYSPR